MTTATETELTPELVERVLKLSPESRDRLLGLLDPVRPPPLGEADRAALRVELQRRHDAISDGTMTLYTIEETMAHLRAVAAEGGGP